MKKAFDSCAYAGLSVLLLISGAVFSQPAEENAHTLFASWFVSNAKEKKKALLNLYPSFEEMCAAAKQQFFTTHGKGTVVLNDHDSTEYTMGFHTPADWTTSKRYPLLIYLHGGVGTDKNDKGISAYDMFSFAADSIPLFLASPSANRRAPWWSVAGLNRIMNTLRFMTLHFPIDPNRIILAGVSDGATGCFAAANSINSFFAGFIAVSGYGGMLAEFGMMLSPSNIGQRPLYVVHGGQDRLYPIQEVNRFLDWLEKNKVHVTRKVYPDEGHGFDYRMREAGTIRALIGKWKKPAVRDIAWTIIPSVPNCAENILSMQANGNKGSIHGTWDHDTLSLDATGIASAHIVFRKRFSKGLFVRYGGSVKNITPREDTAGSYLDCLQHYGFPVVPVVSIFPITF